MSNDLLPGERIGGDLTPGDRVLWRRVSRGGYGFVTEVPATVVRVTAGGRVTIAIDGSERIDRQTVRRTVMRMSVSRTDGREAARKEKP